MAFIWDDLVWILPVFLAVLCYISGDLVQMLFKVHTGIAVKVLSGFVLLLCVFHLTSLPFMYNDWPFTTLYSIFLCDLIAIIIAYLIVSIVKKRIPLQEDLEGLRIAIMDIAKTRWWHFIIWAAVIALIVWHIATVIMHISYNYDDNFYVSESLTILSRNRLMTTLPSCGIEGSIFPATYLLVSWETFLAALSKFFLVSPAVLCHSLLPAFLIPLHYMAFYLAGREFSRRKDAVFLFFVILLNFACGPSTYNQGAFLTLRIWQGKAVLVNILLPLMLYLFLRITKTKKLELRNIFFLFTVLLASQAATTVGTYLAPVLFGVYTLTCLIITRKLRLFLKLLIPIAAIVPFVIWKLLVLLNAGTLGDLSEGSGVYDRSFTEITMRYFGFSLIIPLFILGIIIIAVRLKKGPAKPLRFFFLITTAIMLILFINPWVMPYIERFVTGSGVYWRMFWLLQITIVIAVGFTLLCDIPKMSLARVTLVLLVSLILLVSGRSIFQDEDYRESFDNHAKVSQTTRDIAQYVRSEIEWENPELSKKELGKIEQQTILLLPKELSLELRQYADISQIYYVYYSNNYYAYQTKEEFQLLKSLYNTLYRKETWDPEALYESVSLLGIDYVAITTEAAKENSDNLPFAFEQIYQNDEFTLYKTNGGQ